MLFVRHKSRCIGGEESLRIFMESLIRILLSEETEVGYGQKKKKKMEEEEEEKKVSWRDNVGDGIEMVSS